MRVFLCFYFSLFSFFLAKVDSKRVCAKIHFPFLFNAFQCLSAMTLSEHFITASENWNFPEKNDVFSFTNNRLKSLTDCLVACVCVCVYDYVCISIRTKFNWINLIIKCASRLRRVQWLKLTFCIKVCKIYAFIHAVQ